MYIFAPSNGKGAIAQLVEQRTENPCVPRSIRGGTTEIQGVAEMRLLFLCLSRSGCTVVWDSELNRELNHAPQWVQVY